MESYYGFVPPDHEFTVELFLLFREWRILWGAQACLPSQNYPEGVAYQSPGLDALFAAYPGKKSQKGVNPDRVAFERNPLGVDAKETSLHGGM